MRTFFLALAFAALAAADTVVTKDGRRIEGKIVEESDGQVKLQVKNGAVTIPRHQILEVIHGATTEEIYAERRGRTDATNAAALLDLAKWCGEHGLKKQAEAEYARVLATTDPGPAPKNADEQTKSLHAAHQSHMAAHEALKHEFYEGKWLTFDEYCSARGLVQSDGAWVSPEEARLRAALKEQRELEKAIADKVRDCLRKLCSADLEARDDARAQLDAVPAELMFDPILENLDNRSAEIRAYCIGAISTYKRPEALPRLARRALTDESEALRSAALDALHKLNHPDTWTHIQRGLTSESVSIRIRGANALCEFPNENAAEALLNALVKAAAPRGGFSFGTSEADPRLAAGAHATDEAKRALNGPGKSKRTDGGMGALEDPEEKAKKEQLEREKAAYVRALEKCTGLAYGENLEMWREWYLQKHAATAAKAEMGGKEKPGDGTTPPK